MGDIILLGYFNASIVDFITPIHELEDDAICNHDKDLCELGIQRTSVDRNAHVTTYGQHLLHLGESYALFILNKISCFPSSRIFICFLHSGGVSVMYYVLASLHSIPHILKHGGSPFFKIQQCSVSSFYKPYFQTYFLFMYFIT